MAVRRGNNVKKEYSDGTRKKAVPEDFIIYAPLDKWKLSQPLCDTEVKLTQQGRVFWSPRANNMGHFFKHSQL